MESKKTKICFVIMPFGGWSDLCYKVIYAPAIRSAGLEPKRADDLSRPSTVIVDIWNLTKSSKLLIADLTGRNPNVFYELGLAHAILKPAILITESMDEVPFDLQSLRIIEYNRNNPEWGNHLKKKIKLSIQEVLKSPSEAVLPVFHNGTKRKRRDKLARHPRPQGHLDVEKYIDFDVLNNYERYKDVNEARPLSVNEVKVMVEKWAKVGMSKQLIARRLVDLGVTSGFLINQILKP